MRGEARDKGAYEAKILYPCPRLASCEYLPDILVDFGARQLLIEVVDTVVI